MKIYNVYIIITTVAFLLTTVILAALGETQLSSYYALYIIEALVVTELFIYFNARARRGLNVVSAVLFAGFVITITLQILRR